MKVIFHLDLDSYFVSVQRTIDPTLLNKPVVISSGERRSIISAASYEAKAKGIYVPMPFYRAKEVCPDVIAIPPNFSLYTSLSNKLFEFISMKYTELIEVASIDECYIDVTAIWEKYESPKKLARKMQEEILHELKLPCSIGISNNKFVAKMSTSINKPFGITQTKPGDFHKTFSSWELIKFYGIGSPTAEKLKEIGIKTIGDLARADVKEIESVIGVVAGSLVANANGFGSDELDMSHNELKGIGNSITFQDRDRGLRSEVLEMIRQMASLVSQRAKNRNVVGSVISLSLKVKGGKEVKAKSKQRTLPRGINSVEEIMANCKPLLRELWDGIEEIKFVGVHITRLENIFDTSYQMDIFDKEKRKSEVEEIIFGVNKKFKKKVVVDGNELELSLHKKQNQSRYLESDRTLKYKDKK